MGQGPNGAALYSWQDNTWEVLPVAPECGAQSLMGVWTAEGEDLWISGPSGVMGSLNTTSGKWDCAPLGITIEALHAVTRHKEETLFVGGNYFSTGESFGTMTRYGTSTAPVQVSACAP